MESIAKQDEALVNYFDALLLGAEDEQETPAPQAHAVPAPKARRAVERAAETATERVAASRVVAEPQYSAEDRPDHPQNETTPTARASAPTVGGDDRFVQIQPFTVVGLKLAIESERVHSILDWSDEIESQPGAPDWYLGERLVGDKGVDLIDMARLVVPADYPGRAAIVARKRYQHIILLDDGNWGLACDTIDENVLLPREKLVQAAAGSTRPWLAGTFADYGYAVVNVDYLTRMSEV
jgi:purine-binding chemotaxis protein CheW